jgi:hypothetical protein
MNKNKMYYGDSSFTVFQPVEFNAGPVTLLFDNGYIRNICVNGVEVVKRIYVAVRDQYWNTVPGRLELKKSNQWENDFELLFTCRHVAEKIDFEWQGEITGSENGTLTFGMRGVAHSEFKRNRIGFCVLHPLDLCKNSKMVIEKVDGSIEKTAFPDIINPFLVAKDIKTIEYPINNEADIKISFEGDVFEMEDQRNWSDASFKTYCTPSELPIPAFITIGEMVEQRVSVTFKGIYGKKSSKKTSECVICCNLNPVGKLPEIGLMHNFENQLNSATIELLKNLELSSMRFDIYATNVVQTDQFDIINYICSKTNCKAELVVHFGDKKLDETEILCKNIQKYTIPIKRIIVVNEMQKVISEENMFFVVNIIKHRLPDTPVVTGTDFYFVEINRVKPPVDLIDQISFSLNPQVHTFDNEAIMDNLKGISEIVKTANTITNGKDIVLSPVTLRPRKNKKVPKKAGGYDLRQKGLFAAAWTLGVIANACDSHLKSITLGENAGDGGVISGDGRNVFPVYHLLYMFADFKDGSVSVCKTNDNEVVALVIKKEMMCAVFVANISKDPKAVVLECLPSIIDIKYIDEDTFEDASKMPEIWQSQKSERLFVDSGKAELNLKPYGILIVYYNL